MKRWQMTIQEYLTIINKRFKTGISREHSYRGDLQTLIESIAPDVLATNEPTRIKCGVPDYVLTKKDIPIGFIEAKDIGKDLLSKEYKEQFDRYKKSLNNLLITDYLEFQLYINGEFICSVKIGEIENKAIIPKPENYDEFSNLIKDFCSRVSQTIQSASKLSKMMAGKARMLSQVIEKALNSDEENQEDSTLKQQMSAFKKILIHDIQAKEFADIYAQTIAYGMFAARLHDPTLDTFSRQEVAELIPKSNPFLRKLFQYIAGYDLDSRIVWIVDSLADIFRATNVAKLLKDFGKTTQKNDPIIHFYETFLSEYDPKLRKARGVWYTPEPVVNFIVRAVDDILKTDFGIKEGLSDTSKTTVDVEVQGTGTKRKDKAVKEKREVHKVQILDPAAGTGTFLAEIVKYIYNSKFKGQQGIWSSYVEDHLIPRLNGFELLMASYAMAHLKLDMLLRETGYQAKQEKRFRIYLTNSLEEHHQDTGTLFASWLSSEANEANEIKRETPVMVILGNPPYSGESANKSDWIMKLMEDYKKEPGGIEKLKEKNSKSINDDYVKFMRYGQYFVEKNGEGILAFINAHGFLDNPTFRGMRWNLLKTYDKIYILDLHGNSKKKEVCSDGSPDVNVFDIQQGVSVNLFVKTGRKEKNELGKVYHYDLYGQQELKYDYLWDNNLSSIPYKLLESQEPFYFFVQKDFELEKVYNNGFSVNKIFPVNSVGVVTARDHFTIYDDKDKLIKVINDFVTLDIEDARVKYNLGNDVRDWKVHLAQKDLLTSKLDLKNVCRISYRPFDAKWTNYTGRSKGFHCMPRGNVMKHFLIGDNIGLVAGRQSTDEYWSNVQISQFMIDNRYHFSYKGTSSQFPLYLYPENSDHHSVEGESTERKPNLNMAIVKEMGKKLKLKFTNEKEETGTSTSLSDGFAPIDLLDYIYAVLHSPSYREKYKEFLKIDFPRVPYPKDQDTFWRLVKLGGEIREIHLLESPKSKSISRLILKTGIILSPANLIRMTGRSLIQTKNSGGYGLTISSILTGFL